MKHETTPAPADCCDDWRTAQRSGTDNEGYGRLIMSYPNTPGFSIGCGLPDVNFCPWCGDDKRPKQEDADDAR